MAAKSAGLLMYRRAQDRPIEVFLVHPGGPFWAKKDLAAWSVPKGEYKDDEDPLDAARREFEEETGMEAEEPFLPLSAVKQPSGKIISAWAFSGDFDPARLRSNTFEMEWPKGSGRIKEFPEVDRADWFTIAEARKKILAGQVPFLDELCQKLGISTEEMSASVPPKTRGQQALF
ncbi:MAG: NUDIX domain-containing protein [Hyphomicrobium sp.]|jgi:predicted NUDIX family NTP pyrophosphohydrolase